MAEAESTSASAISFEELPMSLWQRGENFVRETEKDMQSRVRPDEKPEADVNARLRGSHKKLSSKNKRHSMRGKKRSRRM
jgi:hypothetical protein